MYHNPFVPLELAFSEQGAGSLNLLFLAAGCWQPSRIGDLVPPFDGG